jgi:hypothetical protein
MDELEFRPGDVQDDTPPQRVAKRQKNKKLGRLIAGILVGAALIAVAVLWRSPTFDSLRRATAYRKLDLDENKCAVAYTYDSDNSNCYASLGDTLLVASNTHLRLYARGSDMLYEESMKFQRVAVQVAADRAVVYDIGGSKLFVVSKSGLIGTLTTPGEQEIYSAVLNDKGYLTVTAGKSGYKAAVYVYNTKLELAFEYDSSDRFAMTACATDDGKLVATAAMGQSNGSFLTDTVLYKLTGTDVYAEYNAAGGIVYQMGLLDGTICEIAEDRIDLISNSGELIHSYAYDGGYLRNASLQGDGFAVLQLDRYKSGSQGKLVTLNRKGEEIGSLELSGEVLSLSAAGRYVAALYADKLVIYDKDFTVCSELNAVTSAQAAMVRSDGSAVLIGSSSASLYLP